MIAFVVRPEKRDAVLELLDRMEAATDEREKAKLYAQATAASFPARVLGFAGANGRIYKDRDGKVLGLVQRGDNVVSANDDAYRVEVGDVIEPETAAS